MNAVDDEAQAVGALAPGHGTTADEASPPPGDDWREIGFHRPLGGIFYNLVFVFIAAGFGILFAVWFIPNIVFPFPTAMGYQDMVFNMFGILFTILDVGIGASISRFVAAENVKDPVKGIQYIQFFIWFQLISGLLQTTGISLWVLSPAVRDSNIAYASWFMLVYSTVQYPGCLWVFNGALEAYQRFDKARLVNFIQYQIFENGLRIVFILLGRHLGTTFPQVGEIVGATIGSIIGIYLKDFVSAFLSAYWLAGVLREIRPEWKIRNLFHVEFDKIVVKRCVSYGLRAMVPGLVYPLAQFLHIIIVIAYLPNYAAIMGMFLLGAMLSQMITTFGLAMAPSVSESHFNGMQRLTEYYISRAYTWTFVNGSFMLGLLFGGARLLGIIAGEAFFLAVPVIQTLIFFKIAEMFGSLHDNLFHGVGKPEYNIVMITAEQVTRIVLLVVLLVFFQAGWLALVLSQGISWIVKWITGYVVFTRKVFKLRTLNPWQTFVAPTIAMLAEILYIQLLMTFVLPHLNAAVGEVVAALIGMVIGIFTGPFFVFFPVLGLVGGFDEESLRVITRTVGMAGPSKALVNLIVVVSTWACRASPLHNRFPTRVDGVAAEIAALEAIKRARASREP